MRSLLCLAFSFTFCAIGHATIFVGLGTNTSILIDGPAGRETRLVPAELGPPPATPFLGDIAFDPLTGDLLMTSSAGLFRHTPFTDIFVNTNVIGEFEGWSRPDVAIPVPEPSSLMILVGLVSVPLIRRTSRVLTQVIRR